MPGLVSRRGRIVVTAGSLLRREALGSMIDSGAGGVNVGGNGLRGLKDQVEALGGGLQLDSQPGAAPSFMPRCP